MYKIYNILSEDEVKYIVYSLSFFPYRDVSYLIKKIEDNEDLSDLELSVILEKLTFMPYRDVKSIIDRLSSILKVDM
ncbi:MAG: hypothetical protein QXD03_03305 [Candidatus Anstonellales archaeon]